ncbi:MAG TPA: hypothetical protein PLC80_12705 [Draconibacterium sp.]|nr:hypothetical protein [Draconibacterium sp.]
MRNWILLFLFFIFSNSCKYSPNGVNFTEIDDISTPPTLTNLTLDFDTDTLIIWQNTELSFNLKSNKAKIQRVQIQFSDKEFNFDGPSGTIFISPNNFAQGKYILKMKAVTNSGTGSLADLLGAEGYFFEREWVLLIGNISKPKINSSTGIEKGYLKFYWDKLDENYFQYYELNTFNNGDFKQIKITDRNRNFYIDSTFVGGKMEADVNVYYKDYSGFVYPSSSRIVFEYPIKLNLEVAANELILSWNKNPFKHKVLFSINGNQYNYIEADSSYVIKSPGIGYKVNYSIGFQPQISKINKDKINYHIDLDYYVGTENQLIYKSLTYNPHTETYFIKYPMYIRSFNRDLTQIGSYDFSWDYSDQSVIDISEDGKKVYSIVEYNLIQLNAPGMTLHSQTKIPFDDEVFNTYLLRKLSDDKFLIGYESNFYDYFAIYDIAKNKIISKTQKVPASAIIKNNSNFSVSPDGRLASICNTEGLTLFEITGADELKLLYHNTNKYYDGFFDPLNSNQLIINTENNILLWNCAQQKVEKVIDIFANPVNIDPVTNYLFLVSNSMKKVYVYDYLNDKIVYETDHNSNHYNLRLYNNIVFSNSGYHIDISDYVNN